MKVIIAGSRSITDYATVERAMDESGYIPDLVISGGARGVDRLGALWALNHGIPVQYYKPDWGVWGKRAGIVRNSVMAKDADALVAVWDGLSYGTQDMMRRMYALGKPVFCRCPCPT